MVDNDNEHFSLAMKREREQYKTSMKKKEEKSINK